MHRRMYVEGRNGGREEGMDGGILLYLVGYHGFVQGVLLNRVSLQVRLLIQPSRVGSLILPCC